ncbi:N-acetylneuraminate synthase [Synechococcus sp. MIT S9504]|uniref:N-acetylneuraminate synthase n=1 Tax=Synechococcus sp. MIT S9504 TaxID=1801628 RepID=UPI0007BB71DC|nr:N-acetylneuraminate synthase [Synechococcus sp. MIT S9504]KZR85002.1 N,N'-diacetyllegionaminic acid synthase [Synechococcus sp. MIT S9504]
MTIIIAEAGVNHNGDLQLAKKLVDTASDAGADVVKFQTFQASQLATQHAEQAAYQQRALDSSEGQLAMLKRLELHFDQHVELIEYCQQKNIEFFSTAFDISSIELLASLKLKRWKVPSGEITNLPYLRHIGSQGQPVILSTGMANLGEIEAALAVLEQAGTSRSRITVLHCTTEYPAPLDEVNLRAMNTIAQSFGVAVGYSDHTDGISVPIAAVAMGATVIEKHLTLDRKLPGPDHKASLEPDQFAAMVRGIRTIERALGDGIKRPTPSEQNNLPVVRKSLVAARPICAGELFSEVNLTAKRPGTGISPMNWDAWIGRKALRDFAADALIE